MKHAKSESYKKQRRQSTNVSYVLIDYAYVKHTKTVAHKMWSTQKWSKKKVKHEKREAHKSEANKKWSMKEEKLTKSKVHKTHNIQGTKHMS